MSTVLLSMVGLDVPTLKNAVFESFSTILPYFKGNFSF